MAVIQEYKCPCCGGAVEFNSTIQKMKCPYCDTEFDVAAMSAHDEQLNNAPADEMVWETNAGSQWGEGETEGLRSYSCKSCGGEIVGDANTAATECPYCGNPVVLMGQFSGDLKPDYVIPFKLNKEAAKEALKNHYKGKFLLPKVFKDENHIDEIKGMYVPFWLFDADAHADITYKATKVRTWSDSDYRYTETKYYSVFRSGDVGFERVPVDGSTKMPDDLMESIEPYNFKDAVQFNTPYLAGYIADKYDVDADQSVQRANTRIKRSTEESFQATVKGFTSVVPETSFIQLSNGKAKYALYPVWLLNTSWQDKKYLFAMNGQTGKLVGDLPMDKGLFFKWFAGIAGIASAVTFLITYLLWLF